MSGIRAFVVKNNEFQVDNLFFVDDSESIDKIFVQNIEIIKLHFEIRVTSRLTTRELRL